jgi:hypothetical protein
MNTTEIILMALTVLLILGVGLIWLKKKGPGSFEGRVGKIKFKAENQEPRRYNQARQVQKEAVRSTQEQPKHANAEQVQEKTEECTQIIR